ncbi:hypothetical protein Sjap_000896 [Stephania japonica]|uniref:Uncharacterized protein n=1 Tax=Stephania japonica TaxID=461633 RepID=A0AAP0PUI5_9MAGN
MGELQSLQPNGFAIAIEDRLFAAAAAAAPSSPLSSSSSSANPDPSLIGDDCWLRAVETTREILGRIQPTVVSERRREAVIDYVQRLIRGFLGCEVFPFGSVPLKTYLPDGDIDLTALCIQNVEDALASDVRAVLEREEQNKISEFEVKDIQYIHAEVKLVKCLVQNIVVDISFNQLGGLCTLCFLEQVDRLIGKNHLFKYSIILIKAWCYYESRILGAHHGLISTYALETLVLYIFHLFHSSLNNPLAVLYKFLDYFSKFDWDNYCVSLNGPVCLSSLPEIVAEVPDNGGGPLLLSKEFLRNCVETFCVSSKGFESSRPFPQKHLNIIDPLKENNNLGRSVNKGNFYRIRSAFTYGARKLGQILLLSTESIPSELKIFFMNTLDRHGSGQRPDVQDPVPVFSVNGSGPESSNFNDEKSTNVLRNSESHCINSNGTEEGSRCIPRDLLVEGIADIDVSGSEERISVQCNGMVEDSRISSLTPCDSEDGSSSRSQGQGDSDISSASCSEPETSKSVSASFSPLCVSQVPMENGEHGNESPIRSAGANSSVFDNKLSFRLPPSFSGDPGLVARQGPEETELASTSSVLSCRNHETPATAIRKDGFSIPNCVSYTSEDSCIDYREWDQGNGSVSCGTVTSFSDLNGEYESHFNSLLYALWCHEYVFYGPVPPFPSPLPSQFWSRHAFETVHRSLQLKRKMFPHMNANGIVQRPHFYSVNPQLLSGAAFGADEVPKHRGTGTYFPDMNHLAYRDRNISARGRAASPVAHGSVHRLNRDNSWTTAQSEKSPVDKGSNGPILSSRARPGPLEFFQASRTPSRCLPHGNNGFLVPSQKLEFGSLGQMSSDAPSELNRQAPFAPHSQVSSSVTSLTESPGPDQAANAERVSLQSYHLKDDTDFPPLSS